MTIFPIFSRPSGYAPTGRAATRWTRWPREARRRFWPAAGLSASSTALHAADDEVLRIGYLPITDATALLVAHAKGFFEEAGVKAEKPVMMRSWSSLVEGFIMGKFNLVHLLKPIPVWLRYKNHMAVKVLAWAHTNGSGVVVGKDTGVQDLRRPGRQAHRRALLVLDAQRGSAIRAAAGRHHAGDPLRTAARLGPTNARLQIIAPPDMPDALMAKTIDGYIVAEPFNAMAEVKAERADAALHRRHLEEPSVLRGGRPRAHDRRSGPNGPRRLWTPWSRRRLTPPSNKVEVAKLISRDGAGYLLAPSDVVTKAMSDYSKDYEASGAIRHRGWNTGRVDFQPWPYPSATKLIVLAMAQTLVEGDNKFLEGLDPDFVVEDLVDYRFVRQALKHHPEWSGTAAANGVDIFARQEEMEL